MRRVRRLTVAAVVAAVAAAAAVAAVGGGGDADEAEAAVEVATTKVVRTDLANHQEVDGTLHYVDLGGTVASKAAGTLTAVAAEGSIVQPGQPLFWIDQAPVLLLQGQVPAYRDLVQGMRGADVRQLKENLVALGHATWDQLGDDDRFGAATARALRSLQETAGARETGVLRERDALFLPGPARIGAHSATVGAEVAEGTEITAATGTTLVVTVDLEASKADRVSAGDAVEVELPSGESVPATVYSVSSVAEEDDGNGDEAADPTVEVIIALDEPAAAGTIDQAPVDVSITTETAEGVLAVPVSALLALAVGGYGVEIVAGDGTRRLVAVETGMFSDSEDLVEISGEGVTEGAAVVVPR